MNTTTKEKAFPKPTLAIVSDAVDEGMRGLRDALEQAERIKLLKIPHHGADADFVVLTRAVYESLIDAAEDRAATEAHTRAAGEERVPIEVVDRLLAGESPIRVWREFRKMTLDQLGAAAGLSKGYLSDLENGKRAGPVETLQALARALRVSLDELAPAKN
jgi:DNA-binding XRE family transcriptional regulator